MPAKRERQEITLMERLRFLSDRPKIRPPQGGLVFGIYDRAENLLPKRLKGL